MAGVGALVVILVVLFAAPLALGSFIIAQGTNHTRALAVWFGLLTALFIAVLGIGVLTIAATHP